MRPFNLLANLAAMLAFGPARRGILRRAPAPTQPLVQRPYPSVNALAAERAEHSRRIRVARAEARAALGCAPVSHTPLSGGWSEPVYAAGRCSPVEAAHAMRRAPWIARATRRRITRALRRNRLVQIEAALGAGTAGAF